jgi:hypothetical protein
MDPRVPCRRPRIGISRHPRCCRAQYPLANGMLVLMVICAARMAGGAAFMDRAIPWIMLASAVAATGSAIAAAFSACFSSRSSRTAADIAAANLILKIRDHYASNEMFIDLRNLRAWHDKYGSQFAETWRRKLKNDEEAQIVDASRRRVTSFFSNIIDLHDTGLVPKRIEKLLTDFAGFDLLYTIVEPLERALSPDYDKPRFDKLRVLRPASDGLVQFTATNWVIRDPQENTPVRQGPGLAPKDPPNT